MELIYFHKATVHSKEVFLFTSSLGKVLSQAFTWQKACICTVKFANFTIFTVIGPKGSLEVQIAQRPTCHY